MSISSSRVTLQGTGYRERERGRSVLYRNMLGSAKNVVVKYFSVLYRYIFSYAQVCWNVPAGGGSGDTAKDTRPNVWDCGPLIPAHAGPTLELVRANYR